MKGPLIRNMKAMVRTPAAGAHAKTILLFGILGMKAGRFTALRFRVLGDLWVGVLVQSLKLNLFWAPLSIHPCFHLSMYLSMCTSN